jgi:hypothetical protein
VFLLVTQKLSVRTHVVSELYQECIGTPPILKVLASVEGVDVVDNLSVVSGGKSSGK